MSDDRTRVMNQGGPGAGDPEAGRRHLRYLIGALLAVIVGLIVAIVIIVGNEGGSQENTGAQEQAQPTVPVEPDPADSSGGVSPDEGGDTPAEPDNGGSEGSGGSQGGGGSGGISPESPQPPQSGNSGGIGP